MFRRYEMQETNRKQANHHRTKSKKQLIRKYTVGSYRSYRLRLPMNPSMMFYLFLQDLQIKNDRITIKITKFSVLEIRKRIQIYEEYIEYSKY